MHISSGSNSDAKTLIEYDIEKSLDIKEEIIQDEEGQPWENHNLHSEIIQLDEKCTAIESSSNNNSGHKTLIQYNYDETLEIKEEPIQVQENTDEEFNKKYESELCTVDTRETDEKPRTPKKKKIQESKSQPKKEYICEKCARSYVRKAAWRNHKRFECGVMPQFSCEFCDRWFTRKGYMNKHILRVHQKTNSKASQTRHNCDQCSRSYIWLSSLSQHKLLEHAAVRRQLICDFCGFQTKRKETLSRHITSRHFKKISFPPKAEKEYKCKRCTRSYVQRKNLYRHKKYECEVIPQFGCESCGKQFKLKGNMNKHILRVHQKKGLKSISNEAYLQ